MTQEVKVLSAIGAVLIIALVGVSVLISKSSTTPANKNVAPNSELLVRSDSYHSASPDQIGASSSAQVTLVEFGDFQCPACGAAFPTIEQALSDYQEKIDLVFRHFPLTQHPNARIAAEAAEAAGAQGKFYDMYRKLYENQAEWSESKDPLSLFQNYAKGIGLNIDQFTADVKANKFSDKISRDLSDGNQLGVNATPTFFVNGQRIVGVPTYTQLKNLIEADLAK